MVDEKAKSEALTVSHLTETLAKFYSQVVEPGVRNIVNEIVHEEIRSLRSEMNGRFDDLYKKFEDLRQEYLIANHQMKRLEKSEEVLREELESLKGKVMSLKERIEALEKRLETH